MGEILNLTEGVQEYRRERGLDFDIKSFLKDKPGLQAIHRSQNCSPAIKNFAGESEITYAGSGSTRVIRYRPAGVFVGDTEAITEAVAYKALRVLQSPHFKSSPLPVIIPTGKTYEAVYDRFASEELIEQAKDAFKDRLLVSMDELFLGDEDQAASLPQQWLYHTYHTNRDGQGKGLITQLEIDSQNWIIPAHSGDIDKAVKEFADRLSRITEYRLIMAGIGPDAKDGMEASPHLAFITGNMPPSTIATAVNLDDLTRSVNGNNDTRYPQSAITIGPAVVERAKTGIITALGGAKQNNVAGLVLGKFEPAVPATWMQTVPDWSMYMDDEVGTQVRKQLNGGNLTEI